MTTTKWSTIAGPRPYAAVVDVGVHEAKTHLSRLLRLVAEGEDVVITSGGQPVARLSAVDAVQSEPLLGLDEGRLIIAENFDAPLSAEDHELWGS
jgi:prevent-host-death family protein